MFCEHCGKELPNNMDTCSWCGTVSRQAQPSSQPATSYGLPPAGGFGEAQPSSAQERGYPFAGTPSQRAFADAQQAYIPRAPSYSPTVQSYRSMNGVQPDFTAFSSGPSSTLGKNNGAIVAEILLSFFGIFGVGWLMAGQPMIGAALLVASFLIYWPIVFAGTIITRGLGLICLGPIAISAIIVNILLLNLALKRKARGYTSPPSSPYRPWR